MATRQQQKGGWGVQYENLVPKSEWKDESDATILIIDLPGFAKEQIKVTYVHTSRMIRVTGERPVNDRQWIRFNEVFNVPDNCLVDKIHGSFKNNFLTITMPKQTVTKVTEKEKEKETNLPEASKTMTAPLLLPEDKRPKLEEKRFLEESRRQAELEEIERKKPMDDFREQERVIKKLEEEAKAKKQLEEEEVKAKERKRVEEATLKKLEERKLVEEANLKKLEERKLVEEAIEKKKLEEEATLNKIQEKKVEEQSKGKEKITEDKKSGSESRSGSGSGLGFGVGSGAERGLGYLVEKGKEIGKSGNGIMEKIRGKEITSEEKKLMVNVGVAALVIFALGAYVSYTFCSSSSSSSSPSGTTKPE